MSMQFEPVSMKICLNNLKDCNNSQQVLEANVLLTVNGHGGECLSCIIAINPNAVFNIDANMFSFKVNTSMKCNNFLLNSKI